LCLTLGPSDAPPVSVGTAAQPPLRKNFSDATFGWKCPTHVVSVVDQGNSKRRVWKPRSKKTKRKRTLMEAVCKPVESPSYFEAKKPWRCRPPASRTSAFEQGDVSNETVMPCLRKGRFGNVGFDASRTFV
jgi:hypothetical protein